MKIENASYDQIILVGLKCRTNNQQELDPNLSKISKLVSAFVGKNYANHIQQRTKPNVVYSVYTEYESDEHGDYTYFVGEQVKSIENQDLEKFSSLVIPAQNYKKITSTRGKIPDIVIATWQEIWRMSDEDFGGQRSYLADFEVFDQRAENPESAEIDIYIGLK